MILCIYFTTKEGLDEVAYTDPIEIMNTMTTIIEGGQTESQQFKIHVQKQTNEIKPYYDDIKQNNVKLSGDLKKCYQVSDKIKNEIMNINDKKMNYILYKIGKNDLNSLAQYIQELDDTYNLLELINSKLIKNANDYNGNQGFTIQKIGPSQVTPLNDIIKRCKQAGFSIEEQISNPNVNRWR
jgi:hypothetical protein